MEEGHRKKVGIIKVQNEGEERCPKGRKYVFNGGE